MVGKYVAMVCVYLVNADVICIVLQQIARVRIGLALAQDLHFDPNVPY